LISCGKPEGLAQVDGLALDEEDIERHLLEVVSSWRHGATDDADDDFRISLAGAQEKNAFLRWDGKWMKPRGATPTNAHLQAPDRDGRREKSRRQHLGR